MKGWAAFEVRWRDATFAALVPAAPDGSHPGLAAVDTAKYWEDMERSAPGLVRLGLRASLWAVALLPLLLVGRLCFFASLSQSLKDRMLEKMASSRLYLLRQILATLKMLACFAYFRDPLVREKLGAPR